MREKVACVCVSTSVVDMRERERKILVCRFFGGGGRAAPSPIM